MATTVEDLEARLAQVEQQLNEVKQGRIPERLAHLEATLKGHTQLLTKLDMDVREVRVEVQRLDRKMDSRLNSLRAGVNRNFVIVTAIITVLQLVLLLRG